MSEPAVQIEQGPGAAPDMGTATQRRTTPADTLRQIMDIPNIADTLDDGELGKISGKVLEEYQIDKGSRTEWEERIKKANELAMLVSKQKNNPFDKAANIKYPLLTVAALQFNARAYPAIVQGKSVVKCQTWGEDPGGEKAARAKRVSDYTSFQLLSKIPEWEEDTDKMLVMLPIVGCVFRKVYYDPALLRTCTRLVTADRLVVNYNARSLSDVPRITEELSLYPYEIEERMRSGRFLEFDYGRAQSDADAADGAASTGDDSDSPHMFLEQHRLLDLDEDGYPEPYVVTVHKYTEKVVRIVANFDEDGVTHDDEKVISLRRKDYYIKYGFLPSPDGGFYDWGFGWLLKDIGESINTTLNQMMDAGTLANTQGGLVSSNLGLREKTFRLGLGEWKTVNTSMPLSQALYQIQYPGPSPALFNLLGLLIEAGREVANIKDVLSGEQRQNMTATTTLALIEQGMQVFNSIYKRIHRALKKELELHADINVNSLKAEEYAEFFDTEQKFDPAQDYNLADMDILPISDPQVASRTQELARGQFLREWAAGNPLANQAEVQKRVLQAAQIEDVDKLIEVPDHNPLEDEAVKQELRTKHSQSEERYASALGKFAKAMKDLAEAEGVEPGQQLDQYRFMADTLMKEITAAQKEQEIGQRGIPGMEGQPGNAMGVSAPQGGGPGGGGSAQGSALPVNGADTAGMGGTTGNGGL